MMVITAMILLLAIEMEKGIKGGEFYGKEIMDALLGVSGNGDGIGDEFNCC